MLNLDWLEEYFVFLINNVIEVFVVLYGFKYELYNVVVLYFEQVVLYFFEKMFNFDLVDNMFKLVKF